MNEFAVLAAVTALVMLFVFAEIIAAALPLIIVLALVPPDQRRELADLIAACDSSRRLRLWPALRAAVRARRHDSRRDRDAPFRHAGGRRPPVNTPREYDADPDRQQSAA